MTTQLRLIDPTDVDWRLDEQTKEVGRRGLAGARKALSEARTARAAASRPPDAHAPAGDHQSAA
jgi:hypothetical protein